MDMLIYDPLVVADIREARRANGHDGHDEIWDGVYVIPPIRDVEHQRIMADLLCDLGELSPKRSEWRIYPGVNVSDRDEDWLENVRVPDVAVYLPDNPAIDRDTHYQGGPDLCVEILSPNDPARRKREFYASVGVREFLIVDRAPWALELYRLRDGQLQPVATATVENAATLSSEVLPVSFRLVAGDERPAIEVTRRDNGDNGLI